jgi:hypothetical protein
LKIRRPKTAKTAKTAPPDPQRTPVTLPGEAAPGAVPEPPAGPLPRPRDPRTGRYLKRTA